MLRLDDTEEQTDGNLHDPPRPHPLRSGCPERLETSHLGVDVIRLDVEIAMRGPPAWMNTSSPRSRPIDAYPAWAGPSWSLPNALLQNRVATSGTSAGTSMPIAVKRLRCVIACQTTRRSAVSGLGVSPVFTVSRGSNSRMAVSVGAIGWW